MIVATPVDSKGASLMGSPGSLLFRASLDKRRRRAPGDQAPPPTVWSSRLAPATASP